MKRNAVGRNVSDAVANIVHVDLDDGRLTNRWIIRWDAKNR